MGTQKRIIYATKGLAVKKTGADVGVAILNVSQSGCNPNFQWEVPRGVQSVGLTTTFNLEQVFQQGQLAIYDNIEDRPDIEMTVSRTLDGSHPLYLMASDELAQHASHIPTVSGLSQRNSNYQVDLALQIYDEGSVTRAESTPEDIVLASGMFLSSVSYTFPVDGNSTEEITFVGNNKAWKTGAADQVNFFPTADLISSDETAANTVASGITRREDVLLAGFTYTHEPFGAGVLSVIPPDIQALDQKSIQNITISADLGRDEIFALGQKDVYHRVIAFPLEVTCSIEVVTKEGDKIDAMADRDNLADREIVILTTHGLKIDLKSKNKLSSIDFTGGDTGGGEVTLTYNYSNFNDLEVSHLRWA